MKTTTLTTIAAALLVLLITHTVTHSQEAARSPKEAVSSIGYEYASVRFMEEKTSIVWPDGKAENVMELSGKRKFENGTEKYPKGTDYRMYWLTIAMNLMAERGYELAHMQDHDVIMKRQVRR